MFEERRQSPLEEIPAAERTRPVLALGRTVATPDYPNGVGAIQAYSMDNGNFLWQVPVLVNGTAAPVIPRLTTYSVGGKQYIVSFTHFGTLGPDVSAFALP